jgi:hypothetical protein
MLLEDLRALVGKHKMVTLGKEGETTGVLFLNTNNEVLLRTRADQTTILGVETYPSDIIEGILEEAIQSTGEDPRAEGRWIIVPDSHVRHVWEEPAPEVEDLTEGESPEEPGKSTPERVYVGPDFYQDNGTPGSSETGDDCTYLRTEILIPQGGKLKEVTPDELRVPLLIEGKSEEDSPFIDVEKTPEGGWKVCLHFNHHEEPLVHAIIQPDGQVHAQIQPNNIP